MSKKTALKALLLAMIVSVFCLLPAIAVADSQINPAFEAAFRNPATKIDKELCLQSAYASEKVYSKEKIRSFLGNLGFDESSIVQEDYESTATHSVAITMANRIVIGENGKPITLYALIIRGTEGSNEWISDFEVGASDLHTGFNSAAVRVMGHFLKYVRNHAPLEGGLTDENYLLWVTGHSRGAAVANLIAGKYMPKYLAPEKIYAYGYATPNVDKKAYLCRNIINFVIQGDIVPQVPFSDWGYNRYGLTLCYTENTINNIALNSAADTNRLVQMITERVETSEQLSQISEALLQILQGKQQEQQAENPLFLVEGLLSSVLSFGTVSDLIVEMSVAGDIAWLLDALGTDLDTDELFFTDDDFFAYKPLIGPTHFMSTYVLWMEKLVGRIEASGVAPVPTATPLPTPPPTPMPTAVPTPAPTISPPSDPYAIRTESDIQADLMASDFLPAETIAIRNLRIDRRKTDLDDEIDTIYVTFNADTLHIRYTLSYTLTYELFNDGWILTRTKRTAKTAVPLTGISNEELQNFFNEYYVYPSQNKLNNAKLITHSTDLNNLKETLVFQCSRTLNAQTDTWITTLELYFDTQDCQ